MKFLCLKSLKKIMKRIPLGVTMILVTVIAGFFVWAVLDPIQTKIIRDALQSQLQEKLKQQAREDRLNFDRFVKAHYQSVKLFITQKNFGDYVEKDSWATHISGKIKSYRRPPEWFPRLSVLRAFATPRYVILLGPDGRSKEIFKTTKKEPPESLINPSPLLIAKSHGQNFMASIDQIPFLVTSDSYMDQNGKLRATLLIATPIDDEFLSDSLGFHNHLVALLTTDEEPRILVSCNMEELPSGTPIRSLKGKYLITGEEFFDYGAAEQAIKFISLISVSEVDPLIKRISSRERQQRALSAIVFISTFVLLMYWIIQRIENLTIRVNDFSREVLGVSEQNLFKGDQLYALEERFFRLTDEVIGAREALQKEAEERLVLEKQNMEISQKEKQLKLLQAVTDTLGVGVVRKIPEGFIAANAKMEEFAEMFGGLSSFEFKITKRMEQTLTDRDGNIHIFFIHAPEIFSEKIFLVRDITRFKAQQEALEHLALHDTLTGLPNRKLFTDRLQQSIYSGEREHNSFAILMLDLDRFKEINDTLGHHIGDEILRHVGDRLLGSLRKTDTVARFGGDEFMVLLPEADADHAELTAHKLLSTLKRPFEFEDNQLYITASIGIAIFPDHGKDIHTLIRYADIAMYASKNEQSGFSIYNQNQDKNSIYFLELINELRHAIENEELMLCYQPKINLKSDSIIGVEALVRWHHPQRGTIPPDQFIPIAEYTGLIKPLTHWVLNRAIRQCSQWIMKGKKIGISINLSTRNLLDSQLPGIVLEQLKTWELDPHLLELEITESAMMADPVRAMDILKQLDEIGLRLSIDDFGTGYSSLAYLKRLPVDEIKIDKSFVMHMAEDIDDGTIVKSTIELAHNLGLNVIAEGVETKQVWNMLKNLGCNSAQGYYIAKPLSAEEFEEWLEHSLWNMDIVEETAIKNT